MSRTQSRAAQTKPAAKPAKPARATPTPPARGTGRGAAAAQRSGGRTVAVPQVQSDIYTALLGVSLGALLIGCGLLTYLWSLYDFSTKP